MPLQPDWPAQVPAMFRSAAASIEVHRRRLLGHPDLLEASATMWRDHADRLDRTWLDTRTVAERELREWRGEAADGGRARVTASVADLATTASSLRYAADGLSIGAHAMRTAIQRADVAIVTYVDAVRRAHAVAQMNALINPVAAVAQLVRHGQQVSSTALQQVYAQERQLDHVLASLPRRFVLGKASAWRRGIMRVTEESATDVAGGALTILGWRGRRSGGVQVSHDTTGRYSVTLSDSYSFGPKWNAGAKLDLDRLPAGERAKLQRLYVEAEGGGVVTYSLRYHFGSAAQAQEFVDRVKGRSLAEKTVATVRDAAGFPFDTGPVQDRLLGRRADEGTVAFGAAGKVNGDIGMGPVFGGQAMAGADRGATFVWKAGGEYSWLDQAGAGVKAGGQVLHRTENAGAAGRAVTRVDYDDTGRATRYILQTLHEGEYDYRAGTNNTYLGAKTGFERLSRGAHVKGDLEGSIRTVVSESLDLEESGNRALYERAQDSPEAAAELRRRLDDQGVITVQRYAVERHNAELSADLGIGPVNVGMKGGPAGERYRLLDASYSRRAEPGGRDLDGAVLMRPAPYDPH
jgi:hypothetical protein